MKALTETNQQTYFNHTKTAYFGFMITIPLFLIYEIGTLITGSDIRNGAEMYILQVINTFFHEWTLLVVGALYLTVLLIIIFYRSQKRKGFSIRKSYMLYAFLESFLYSWLLAPAIGLISSIFMLNVGSGAIITSFGAGFFEELVFRVILFGGLFFFAVRYVAKSNNKILLFIIIATFTSIVFSLVHYIGPLGDPFEWSSFLFRFLAGMIFCLLYFLRGFGVAAWTHALYDVWIISGIFSLIMPT